MLADAGGRFTDRPFPGRGGAVNRAAGLLLAKVADLLEDPDETLASLPVPAEAADQRDLLARIDSALPVAGVVQELAWSAPAEHLNEAERAVVRAPVPPLAARSWRTAGYVPCSTSWTRSPARIANAIAIRASDMGPAEQVPAMAASHLRWVAMPANRMNRGEFYTAMAPCDDANLRKVLWTLYWRGNAQLRERIEDELRSPEQAKVKPKKELPDPGAVLVEVTTFVGLAKDGAYMAGDRRVHHTERSKWRLTFRRLAGDALAALHAEDPGPAQQAVAEMVDLACDMKSYDYFHSDDPVEAAKFVVSDAVAALWESVLRYDGFAAFARRVPEQLIRWESAGGWTRRGYGQVPERETALADPLARLLTTPDMWRTFAGSYLDALDTAGRADPGRPRTVYGSFDETRYRRGERARDLATWHEMLLDRFAGTPEDELLDRLAVSPALAGPELTFLRARIAECRGDVAQAAALVTECLNERPGDLEYIDLAVEVGAVLPPRAREIHAERMAAEELDAQGYREGRVPSD